MDRADSHTETCRFFVDDSNIWIEAQKFAASGNSHMPKLADSEQDPRLRIDVGKLIDALRGRRVQGYSFLYGSRPPPNDSVWAAFQRSKFETKIYDRANGKEKEVDNSMVADLSSAATTLSVKAEFLEDFARLKAKTVFVAVTGDRDVLPAIMKVLEAKIRVELWAWRSGISREYLKLDAEHSLFSVQYLDSIFQKISFTNYRSTRKGGKVVPSKTVVLCKLADQGGDKLEALVSGPLVTLGRVFYLTLSRTENEVYVEFPNVENVESMVLAVRDLFKGTLTVLSWPEYANRLKQSLPALVETSNRYEPLATKNAHDPADLVLGDGLELATGIAGASSIAQPEDGIGQYRESQGVDNSVPDNDWQTVARSDLRRQHHRSISQTQSCSEHIRCRKRGECGYLHSDEERRLFQDFPGKDFSKWKTKQCTKDSRHQPRRCGYAHSQAEAWCLRCRVEGHFTDRCRHSTSN
jgi:hypothetical protein